MAIPFEETGGDLVRRLGAAERHVERMSREVLDLYRQVNLLYRIGDSINACLGAEEICRLVLSESVKILRARGGHIRLLDGTSFGCERAAPRNVLTVPIETPQGRLGEVTVYEKRRGDFTAADEKLIRAVARQAGIALDNTKLIEGLIGQNTELERLNEELKALDRMKSDFVSNVSHELRTPLSSIKGFAATILDDAEMPPEILHEFVSIINDESDKLIVIINDILDISKVMSGEVRLERVDQAIDGVLREVVTLLAIQAERKGLELRLDVESSGPVRCDATRIGQIFTNLVGNAIKFTDAGYVRLREWVSDGEVHVAVEDSGVGIPADQLEHIFDKFFRVENVVHTKEGTGLGLALVRTLVEQHAGRIDVTSRPGEGTIITVSLPLAPRGVAGEESG